jgi:hypothetical protein
MGKLLRRLQFIVMLSGLVVLGLNFANPKVATATLGALKEPLMVKKIAKPGAAAAAAAQHDPEADAALQQKRYVQIQGKLYEYNPRGSYNVNGVPTMYKNGNPKTWEQIQKERADAAAALKAQMHDAADDAYGAHNKAAIETVQKMAEQGPLSVYSPGGVKAVMDGARAAADAMNQRNKALNQLDE